MSGQEQKRKWLVANWKMHKTVGECDQFVRELVKIPSSVLANYQILLAPQFPFIKGVMDQLLESKIGICVAAQNCSDEKQGAYTGEVSPVALSSLGCKYVLLGHLERRKLFGETSVLVAKKARCAVEAGMIPIICLGEQHMQKDQVLHEIDEQLLPVLDMLNGLNIDEKILWAYEPGWAIGAHEAAALPQIRQAHLHIKECVRKQGFKMPTVLYGGAVTFENSKQFLDDSSVDGLLLGRASLTVSSFLRIIGFEV